MTQTAYYPDWKERITYSAGGPSHQELMVTETFRAVLVGLEAGLKIAPHKTSAGAYYFLEGSGWMIVDGERLRVKPGITITVSNGAARGVEAETRVAFLGTQAVMAKPTSHRKPPIAMLVMMGAMLAFMAMIALMFSGMSPMTALFASGRHSIVAWVMVLVPIFIMLGAMFFAFRMMTGHAIPLLGLMQHGGTKPKVMGTSGHSQMKEKSENVTSRTYDIPSVSCAHCKMKIERSLSKLEGVASVNVDVSTQKAIITFAPPATEIGIQNILEEIGYPPVWV